MTVLIAKMLSLGGPSATFAYENTFLKMPAMGWVRTWSYSLRKEFFTLAFIAISIFFVIVYIAEINMMILEGRKLPQLQAELQTITQELRVKNAILEGLRSPVVIRDQALNQHQMVPVTAIHYLGVIPSVAVR